MEEKKSKSRLAIDYAQTGNFKRMYRKTYGEIASMSNTNRNTPEMLFDMVVAYFEWAESNYLKTIDYASFQGDTVASKTARVRVFTWSGLRLFCAVSEAQMLNWRKMDGYKEVMEFAENVIYEQKFQLAANGIINASFIGKELGIDKGEVSVTQTNTMNDVKVDELKDAVTDILGKI